MVDLGFRELSMEPVVAPAEMDYALTDEDVFAACTVCGEGELENFVVQFPLLFAIGYQFFANVKIEQRLAAAAGQPV